MYPDDLRYSKEHEWVRVQSDGTGTVGITSYAQEQLGDVVYVDLPQPGAQVSQFQKLGEIESVKAVSDLYSPVSGQVLEANQQAKDKPELVNQDPYGAGWLLKVRIAKPKELDALMAASQYKDFLTKK